MICFKDTTFCSAADRCETQHCRYRLDKGHYERWCKKNFNIPVAYMDRSHTCVDFKERIDGNKSI